MHEKYDDNCMCYRPFSLYHTFLCTWKDYVYAMDINITESTQVLSRLVFPHLEDVKLTMDEVKSYLPYDTLVAFLQNHKGTLKKLSADMDFIKDLSDENIGTAPNVEHITFYGTCFQMMDSAFKALLEYGQNVKVLDYHRSRVDASDVHLPFLKRFHPGRWIDESYAPFLVKNGSNIETIVSPFFYR